MMVEDESPATRWVHGVQAFARLARSDRKGTDARDPGDARPEPGVWLSVGAFPELLARFAGDHEWQRLLAEQPSIDSHAVDFAALSRLPAGSLGHEYALHMSTRNLDSDVWHPPQTVRTPEWRFLMKRLRQTHDIWHVVTGYDTDVPGEIEVQAFMFGQLGTQMSLLTAAGGIVRYFKHPVMRGIVSRAWRAYRRGRRTPPLMTRIWEARWAVPLADVRAEVGLTPVRRTS